LGIVHIYIFYVFLWCKFSILIDLYFLYFLIIRNWLSLLTHSIVSIRKTLLIYMLTWFSTGAFWKLFLYLFFSSSPTSFNASITYLQSTRILEWLILVITWWWRSWSGIIGAFAMFSGSTTFTNHSHWAVLYWFELGIDWVERGPTLLKLLLIEICDFFLRFLLEVGLKWSTNLVWAVVNHLLGNYQNWPLRLVLTIAPHAFSRNWGINEKWRYLCATWLKLVDLWSIITLLSV